MFEEEELKQAAAKLEALLFFAVNDLNEEGRTQISANLPALVVRRVLSSGEGPTGAKFSPYSDNGLKPFKLLNRSLSAGAESRFRNELKKGLVSYKKFRELNNRKTGFKNFEFSGEMWRKFGAVESQAGEDFFLVVFGGLSEEAQKKINFSSEREGLEIIAPSPEEVEILAASLEQFIADAVKIIFE